MKNIMYNKHIVRILSSFMLCVLVLSSAFPVYAQQSESFSDRMSRMKTKICNACDKIFDDAQILHDSFVDLYDDFVLSCSQATQDAIMMLQTDVEIYKYVFNSFTTWLKKNKLFGVQKELNGVPVPDEFMNVIRRNKPSGALEPETDVSTADTVSGDSDVYDVAGFTTNYPYSFGRQWLKDFIFTSSTPNDYTGNIWQAQNDPINNITWSKNANIDNQTKMITVCSSYQPHVPINMWGGKDPSSGETIIFIRDLDAGNWSSYYKGTYAQVQNWHIDGDYLYFDGVGQAFENMRAYRYNNGWGLSSQASSYYSAPFTYNGRNFFNYCVGNYIIDANDHTYLFYHGQWYDCPHETGYTYHQNAIVRLKLENRYSALDISDYERTVNNYISIFNTVNNTYPDTSLSDILDILNQLNVYQDISDLRDQLDILTQELQEQQQELEDIRGLLANIKSYCKKINQKLTDLFDLFDSLFTNTGAFALSVQLDNLFHHLEQTINNLPIPSSSGSSTTNFNFGDFDLHLEATFNSFFTMNDTQKQEINTQINTIKAPFSWMGNLFNNTKTMLGKMVARSAYYAGQNYNSEYFSPSNNTFTELDITVSENGFNPTNYVGGSDISNRVYYINGSYVTAPTLTMHFSNSTSDINYGGDATVLDFSWYAPYKPVIDKFIICFCWAVFIWHTIRSIPGIIGGVDGYVSDVSSAITSENVTLRNNKREAAYNVRSHVINARHRMGGR